MTYAEKLKHPRWQKCRLQILERDHWACVYCLDKETNLQVHHKRYIKGKEPWDYEHYDLEAICEDCHKYLTEHIKAGGNPAIFETLKIVKDSFKILFIYTENGLRCIPNCQLDEISYSHATLKKLTQFIINCSLKHA